MTAIIAAVVLDAVGQVGHGGVWAAGDLHHVVGGDVAAHVFHVGQTGAVATRLWIYFFLRPGERGARMFYSYVELEDETHIAHSNVQADGVVEVLVERPVEFGFDSAICTLPAFE